jgi:hypothetical protein
MSDRSVYTCDWSTCDWSKRCGTRCFLRGSQLLKLAIEPTISSANAGGANIATVFSLLVAEDNLCCLHFENAIACPANLVLANPIITFNLELHKIFPKFRNEFIKR